MDIKALGFYDVDELHECCKGMLARSCERHGIKTDDVEGLLAKRHLSIIMGNIDGDDGWYAMEDFVECLQQEIGDSIPLERRPAALAASIVDNMVRQAIADIDLTSEDFSKRIFEAIEVDDYCPDVTVGHQELLKEHASREDASDTAEAGCWLEFDDYDNGDAALCVETDHGVEVYAPIVISDAHGTPERQSVDVYYREPFLDVTILLGTVNLPEGLTLAEAVKGYVMNNYDAATRMPERLKDKGWTLTDLGSMQMQKDNGDRAFEMYEVTSGWDGTSWAFEHATFHIGEFSQESLEMAASGYYDKGQDGTCLSGLAEACGRRCAAFGDDDYPYGILAEIVFECGLCDKTTSALYATREAAMATVISRVLADAPAQDVRMAVGARHM